MFAYSHRLNLVSADCFDEEFNEKNFFNELYTVVLKRIYLERVKHINREQVLTFQDQYY